MDNYFLLVLDGRIVSIEKQVSQITTKPFFIIDKEYRNAFRMCLTYVISLDRGKTLDDINDYLEISNSFYQDVSNSRLYPISEEIAQLYSKILL